MIGFLVGRGLGYKILVTGDDENLGTGEPGNGNMKMNDQLQTEQ
ncbi:MAG: hypothetical protein NT040_17010 [Bacteroidetes bacterium]|nr:hypothetical protein [Bacteroidota bacterium]